MVPETELEQRVVRAEAPRWITLPWVGAIPALALVCLVCVVLRLPAFGYRVISDDEGIYDAMGQVIAQGGVMYHDTVDHKPPALAYSYAAIRRLTASPADARHPGAAEDRAMAGVHLLGLLAAVGTCLALFALAGLWLPPSMRAVPALLYAVVSVCKPPVDGLAVNGELLMNLPLALGALCAVLANRRRALPRAGLDLAAGALIAVATLYKYQAGLLGLALPLLILGASAVPGEGRARGSLGVRLRTFVVRGFFWAAGFAGVLALVALYFHARQVWDEALFWGIAFNRNYVQQGPGFLYALERLGLQLASVVLPGAGLYACAAFAVASLFRGRAPLAHRIARSLGWKTPLAPDPLPAGEAYFLLGWAALSVAAVGLGGRFFGHYFLQAELPLSFLAAGALVALYRRFPQLAIATVAAPALAFFGLALFPSFSGPLLDPGAPDYATLGRAIDARTSPGDTIWAWGNVPQLYSAAARAAGVRFTFCNYLTGLSPATPSESDPRVDPSASIVQPAWPMVIDDLEHRRPKLVIDTARADLKAYGKFPIARYPLLADYLARHYRYDGEVLGVGLYVRLPDPPSPADGPQASKQAAAARSHG